MSEDAGTDSGTLLRDERRSRRRGRRVPRLTAASILLGLFLLAATLTQHDVRFSGLRWIPAIPPPGPHTRSARPRPAGAGASPAPSSAAQPRGTAPDLSWLLWVGIVVAAAVTALILWRWWRHRAPAVLPALIEDAMTGESVDEPVQTEEEQPDAPTMLRGFDRAVELLDTVREPRDAVVQAWLGLQEAAADSGIRRRGAETPTEFTRRMVERVPDDRAWIDTLLGLYLGVRFGAHPVTARDIDSAKLALTRLASSWRSDAHGRARS